MVMKPLNDMPSDISSWNAKVEKQRQTWHKDIDDAFKDSYEKILSVKSEMKRQADTVADCWKMKEEQ